MRSLQDYRDIYKEIAKNYNITGDSVELLVQLLANASYISEVENISYMQEASLEKCTLINSKIHHCMDMMYSVFRGRCPRVIIKFMPTKYHEFNVYDTIVSSNDFNVYYLGYIPQNEEGIDEDEDEPKGKSSITGTKNLPLEEGFVYGPCVVNPAVDEEETVTIIGLIAKEKITQSWTTSKYNTYYVETLEENLSNDMYVKIDGNFCDTTRIFSDHILNHYIFDLTTTSFSSRLYVADIYKKGLERNDEPGVEETNDPNTTITATYYKFSKISEYKPAELKKINISGAEMVSFDLSFLDRLGKKGEETAPGVIIIPEVDREGVGTIHYKANRDRYVESIIRSNSDVGTVLEEMYPAKVREYGTNYIFNYGESSSRVDLYYVPINITNLLTDAEIAEFIETKKAYYVVDDIYVSNGRQFTAFFTIDVELYKPFTIDNSISDILNNYSKRFNVDMDSSLEEIQTLISKVSNIKQVRGITVNYLDPEDNEASLEDLYDFDDESKTIKPDIYFKIEYNINSIIQTRS